MSHTTRRRSLSALIAIAALVCASTAGAAPSPRPLATFTVDRPSSGTPTWEYTWTVPKNIRKVVFDVRGASGGGTSSVPGGLGGRATATVAVKPGWVFEIVVGGEGTLRADFQYSPFAFNGGGPADEDGIAFGGGGGSDVRAGACAATKSCEYTDRVVVAGGGGGAGDAATGSGGDGGGTTGDSAPAGCEYGGAPGRESDGFAFGQGDYGQDQGGGGGGGWYGGFGGYFGCGGGGGSGHIDPLALTADMQNGVHAGDGVVRIYKG